MKYKLVLYQEKNQDDDIPSEFIIDEKTFRQYQESIAKGKTVLILDDMIIKTSAIKMIVPIGGADEKKLLSLPIPKKPKTNKESEEKEFEKIWNLLKKNGCYQRYSNYNEWKNHTQNCNKK